MNLASWQKDFRDWLTDASDEAAQRLGQGATVGLSVYQNNYRAQLVSVLEASYPHVLAQIGPEFFLDTAIAHIDSHPPHAWTLDVYGADFETTLRDVLPHNPDIHELAWIEWSLGQSFVSRDAESIPADALAHVDWDNARLHLTPSLRQRRVTTNVDAVWLALDEGRTVPESEMLDADAAMIIWRQGYACRLKQVDIVESAALQSLRDDDRFASLCDLLAEHLGEEQGIARAGELLADWISAGIVTRIDS